MPAMTGVISSGDNYTGPHELPADAGPVGPSNTESVSLREGFLSVTCLTNSPLKGARFVEQDNHVACFAGDLVGIRDVPFDLILGCASSGDFSALSNLRGNFAIGIFDKSSRRLFLVTDRRAQQPLYYLQLQNGVVFSTEMSVFCRLKKLPAFNRKWLYECMFFNYPMAGTTFLEGVTRVPPASVWTFDLASKESATSEYVGRFRKSTNLLKGDAALEKALAVFRARVPEYCRGAEGAIAFGLSGGWDSRTILSFCPLDDGVPIRTYTYGIPDCDDLTEARKIADALGLEHSEIRFDEEFVRQLPGLIPETVYLTFGALGILRATMLYLHKRLTWDGEAYPIIVTGISGDQMFRGHGNVPAIIPRSVATVFSEGKPIVGAEPFRSMFGKAYGDFRDYVTDVIDGIRNRFGELGSSECHLSYLTYEVAPKHFLGDMLLGNRFSTFRVPFWDDDIVQLAYDIEFSTLTFSKFTSSHTDWRMENRLNAYLLASNPSFAKLPVERFPLSVIQAPNAVYQLYRWFVHKPRRLLQLSKRPARAPLLSWQHWISSEIKTTIDDSVFSRDAHIRDYIDPEFLKALHEQNRRHWIGKIATAELVLRMLDKGWRT